MKRILPKVMTYGYQCGIFSTRKLEEACKYRVDFMWLLENGKAPDHSTLSRFRTGRCAEAVEDLFYQYVQLLEKQGEVDHKTVFIDGTKLESRAGRYSFVWRGNAEKGMEKAKAAALEQTGCKELPELEALLAEKAKNFQMVSGKGKRKSPEQKEWEGLNHLCQQWRKYEEQLKIMGDDRNSYSKTDHDATFMRMKEDHMRNGQLKAGYNVQLAVNSEYITGMEVFSNRTDVGTLRPFLRKLELVHKQRYEEVTADAGYESLENYLYLEANGQTSFIKPANYEAQKTKKFRSQIGRIENMKYDEHEDCYICAQGRKLRCRKQDVNAPKEVIRKETFWEKRKISQENITSERGILLRRNRSIQVEGAFGLLKNDFGFRRFLTTGKKNVRVELFFLALGFNLKKRWMKQEKSREKTHYSEKKAA